MKYFNFLAALLVVTSFGLTASAESLREVEYRIQMNIFKNEVMKEVFTSQEDCEMAISPFSDLICTLAPEAEEVNAELFVAEDLARRQTLFELLGIN